MSRTANAGRAIMFLAVTFVLVLITTFCVTGTVMCKSNYEERELENYYRKLEQDLLRETKEMLEEMGYSNSGVTLTRVVDTDGSRVYTFLIHHKRIGKMNQTEKMELAAQLANVREKKGTSAVSGGSQGAFGDNCIFHHEFLVYE